MGRAAWEAAEQRAKEILQQTAGLVATELSKLTGEPWVCDHGPDTYGGTLIRGSDGLQVNVGRGPWGKPDVITVTGTFEARYQDRPYDTNYTKINVNRLRGPEVIAREIVRRLLPLHEPEHVRVAEAHARSEAWRASVNGDAESLAAILPHGYTEKDGRFATRGIDLGAGYIGYVDGQAHQDSVTMKISGIPFFVADAIAKLIRNAGATDK